jgi:hypothetical protein
LLPRRLGFPPSIAHRAKGAHALAPLGSKVQISGFDLPALPLESLSFFPSRASRLSDTLRGYLFLFACRDPKPFFKNYIAIPK